MTTQIEAAQRCMPPAPLRKKKRVSLVIGILRGRLRKLAQARRILAVNRWTGGVGFSLGYAQGAIHMANVCGRISDAKEKQLLARLHRIHGAKITRLDQRLLYVAGGR